MITLEGNRSLQSKLHDPRGQLELLREKLSILRLTI